MNGINEEDQMFNQNITWFDIVMAGLVSLGGIILGCIMMFSINQEVKMLWMIIKTIFFTIGYLFAFAFLLVWNYYGDKTLKEAYEYEFCEYLTHLADIW